MLSEIISGVQGSVGFRPGQGSRQGVGLSIGVVEGPVVDSPNVVTNAPQASCSSHTVTQPVSFGPTSLTSLTQPNAISSSQEDPAKAVPIATPFPSVQAPGLPSASCRDAPASAWHGYDPRADIRGIGELGLGSSQGVRPGFPEINRPPTPVVSPADPAQRGLGASNLPVNQDPALLTIARSIAQLQELQKEALRTQPGPLQ